MATRPWFAVEVARLEAENAALRAEVERLRTELECLRVERNRQKEGGAT